jgi:hypothetical protein
MGKRLDDMKADFLAVSARVRYLEDKVTNFHKTLTECENSCQSVSKRHPYKEFDWLKRQVNSSNLLRTADFITWVQSPISYYTVVSSFLQ